MVNLSKEENIYSAIPSLSNKKNQKNKKGEKPKQSPEF